MSQLLDFTSSGIYCPLADVYIDPWRPVDRAIITHAHADHARIGNRNYLAHTDSVPLLKHMLGAYISIEGVEYNQPFYINGVKFSLHPAGHIVGSAQVRVEYKGEVWVVTGDFKLVDDKISRPFEPLKCDVLITDSTFGLPIFEWQPQEIVFEDLNNWWLGNTENNQVSVVIGYTLGKTQRLLHHLERSIGPVYAHGSIETVNQVLRNQGINIASVRKLDMNRPLERNSLILAMPSIIYSPLIKELTPCSIAAASGWMSLRGARNTPNIDKGFVLSDHADWHQLIQSVKETGASKIFLTSSGYSSAFCRWLVENGYDVTEIETKFTGEIKEIEETLGVGVDSF
jgi:putative mRNA 3-end processing factor